MLDVHAQWSCAAGSGSIIGMDLMFIGPCIIVIVEEWKTNLMSLVILFHVILFHFLCAQHVSDINISIIRGLRLLMNYHIGRLVLSSLCAGAFGVAGFWWCSFCRLKPENTTTDVVIHQHSRKLLKMDILMSETCWAHNKWNKTESDIKLVFHSSTIAMMHGPINIRFTRKSLLQFGFLHKFNMKLRFYLLF